MGLNTGIVDDFTRESLFEDELAPKTVHDILVMLRGIMKYTTSLSSDTFPTIEIHYPKIPRNEMRVLSREEQDKLIAYLLVDMDACKFGVLLTLLPEFALASYVHCDGNKYLYAKKPFEFVQLCNGCAILMEVEEHEHA